MFTLIGLERTSKAKKKEKFYVKKISSINQKFFLSCQKSFIPLHLNIYVSLIKIYSFYLRAFLSNIANEKKI